MQRTYCYLKFEFQYSVLVLPQHSLSFLLYVICKIMLHEQRVGIIIIGYISLVLHGFKLALYYDFHDSGNFLFCNFILD